MTVNIAVLGATGNVGTEMLAILDERRFPAGKVHALASRRSLGREVSYGDRVLKCQDAESFDYSTVDIVLMSAGGDAAREMAPRISASGALMIDNSSAFRMDEDVPLVVPEVNPQDVAKLGPRRIIANPNCSTAQLVVTLKPLHDRARIKRVVVSTYQSVSGAGKAAMDELWNQTKGIYVGQEAEPEEFAHQIAFNVIPQIDRFMEDGSTREEWKMAVETTKIMGEAVPLTATCVRVPVFVGHSEAVHVELEEALPPADARALLRESPGLMVVDDPEEELYITPLEAVGEWATYVSRLRRDPTVPHGLAYWCVSDNLRKGAALNAVQIAETYLNQRALA